MSGLSGFWTVYPKKTAQTAQTAQILLENRSNRSNLERFLSRISTREKSHKIIQDFYTGLPKRITHKYVQNKI